MRQEVIQKAPEQVKKPTPNMTGIPTQMKLDFERRSGLSFDDVRVHYNSDKPAKIGALAYTQGNQVHVGPGQEKHLRHELGHVVQQKTKQILHTKVMHGLFINDDAGLEAEAERYSDSKAITHKNDNSVYTLYPVIQGLFVPAAIIQQIESIGAQTSPDLTTLNALVQQCFLESTRIVRGDAGKGYYIEQGTKRSKIVSIPKIIKWVVEEVNNANISESESVAQIPFGFELTFNNEAISKLTAAELNEPAYGAPKIAGEKLTDFAKKIFEYMSKKAGRAQKTIKVTKIELLFGDQKWMNKNYKAQKVTVSFYSAERGTWNWEINVDLDPACIEVQLDPFTINEQEIYRPFINDIFLAAKDCGLEADPNPDTGGGGHISIDARAFGDNPHFLLNFMALYNRLASHSAANWANECRDIDNAPLMAELGTLRDFETICVNFSKHPGMPLKDLVEEIKRVVYQGKFTEKLKRILESPATKRKVDPAVATHYQAINLDHLLDEGGTARLEMRRFNAQSSSAEMFAQMHHLARLLMESRQKVRLYL